jgi:hypothetical protein
LGLKRSCVSNEVGCDRRGEMKLRSMLIRSC